MSPEEMAPWFAQMEERLGVAKWEMGRTTTTPYCATVRKSWAYIGNHPTQRARLLELGLLRHRLPHQRQAIHVSYYHSSALEKGAKLVYSARVERLLIEGRRCWARNRRPR